RAGLTPRPPPRRAAGLAWDEAAGDLGRPGIGPPDPRRELDGGMAHEEALDLHRIHVLTADLQHVLVPPEESQVAVRAHDPHVARVEPAVRVENQRGVLRLLVVARRDHVAPGKYFSGHRRRL